MAGRPKGNRKIKLTVPLLALTLLPVYAHADPNQTPTSAATIAVTRTSNGCDIALPQNAAQALTDQVFLVIDGNSESFGGGLYFPDAASKPLHYTASVSNDLDNQVKEILKAQGIPVKDNVTTYHVICGVNIPNSVSVSKSLTFRHEANVLGYTQYPTHANYKIGDKIPLFEAVALDTSVATSGILGKSTEKQNQLPHDQLHRITIQVQFVPKTLGNP